VRENGTWGWPTATIALFATPPLKYGLVLASKRFLLGDVTLEDILGLLRGSRPFTLRMVSGRVIEVPHPDFVALSPERTFIVLVVGGQRLTEFIRINQIESFETADDSSAA